VAQVQRTYDAIVIDAGSTGENVAAREARRGFNVAIAEADLVGGDCCRHVGALQIDHEPDETIEKGRALILQAFNPR
jgi:hypothetical protein